MTGASIPVCIRQRFEDTSTGTARQGSHRVYSCQSGRLTNSPGKQGCPLRGPPDTSPSCLLQIKLLSLVVFHVGSVGSLGSSTLHQGSIQEPIRQEEPELFNKSCRKWTFPKTHFGLIEMAPTRGSVPMFSIRDDTEHTACPKKLKTEPIYVTFHSAFQSTPKLVQKDAHRLTTCLWYQRKIAQAAL